MEWMCLNPNDIKVMQFSPTLFLKFKAKPQVIKSIQGFDKCNRSFAEHKGDSKFLQNIWKKT